MTYILVYSPQAASHKSYYSICSSQFPSICRKDLRFQILVSNLLEAFIPKDRSVAINLRSIEARQLAFLIST